MGLSCVLFFYCVEEQAGGNAVAIYTGAYGSV